MNFIPTNRHLLVDMIEEPEEKNDLSIVLPEEFNKPVSPYAKMIVIAVAEDSKFCESFNVN